MEVRCNNHKETKNKRGSFKRVQSMGGIQMQTKYKMYTTYILKSSCLIGETCPIPSQNVAGKSSQSGSMRCTCLLSIPE
jgi:hypothetical protein